MKTLENIEKTDHIAFVFSYNGEEESIIVSNITSISSDGSYLVHFMDGHNSLGEHVKKENILAIGNLDSNIRIKGWGGRYDIIQEDHPLIIENSYEV